MRGQFVNVVGLGYIGLPTAMMMAAHGVRVAGTDCNRPLVEALKAGRLPFREEGLEELFAQAQKSGILFSTDDSDQADIYIVAVPTPYDKSSKRIDPHYVIAAVKKILEVCKDGAIVVVESTVSPGTMDRYIRPLLQDTQKKIHLAHAPERIIPGNMIDELRHNSRTVGADDRQIGERVKAVYGAFCQGDIEVTDIRTAEMTKVVENTYRDVNIAFANELLKICARDGMDVNEIIRIANKHPRVNILAPGPGVGGHCIAVDPWFLVGDYPELANLIRLARQINDGMPGFVLERVSNLMEEKGIHDFMRVGFYGLTYKENVDDVRESPTLQLIGMMKRHLSDPPKCYDPMVKRDVVEHQYRDFEAFVNDIDLMVVMIHHTHLDQVCQRIQNKVILDTRNCDLPWGNSNRVVHL